MKHKLFIITLIILVLFLAGFVVVHATHGKNEQLELQTQTATVQAVSSQIVATGTITAQNQATLHFQTGGKVVYLPFKEGDTVAQGQMIAQLDTYALQKQLQEALNTYRTTRNTFDQTQQNTQDNVLQGQQQPSYTQAAMDKSNAINDAVKRIVDENQANLDNAVINVELANYAQTLATITSPLSGVITHEDISVPNITVTPTTSFTVADMTSLIFRTTIADTDIASIHQGDSVKVLLTGNKTPITATVTKIYPDKVTLSSGGTGYQVDISADAFRKTKLDQAGTALIQGDNNTTSLLIPAWTVLANKYVWVLEQGNPVLKTVQTGTIHGNMIEITGGLSASDKIISNPEVIPQKEYQLL